MMTKSIRFMELMKKSAPLGNEDSVVLLATLALAVDELDLVERVLSRLLPVLHSSLASPAELYVLTDLVRTLMMKNAEAYRSLLHK